jgi:DNA-directed RNA polymerase specialized sigma24 family protein
MERRAAMAEQIISGRVINACQEGDRDAFRVLFETYKDKVYSIAVYSSGGDATFADDVTQQIFLSCSLPSSNFGEIRNSPPGCIASSSMLHG